jgi:hypothetical protein
MQPDGRLTGAIDDKDTVIRRASNIASAGRVICPLAKLSEHSFMPSRVGVPEFPLGHVVVNQQPSVRRVRLDELFL